LHQQICANGSERIDCDVTWVHSQWLLREKKVGMKICLVVDASSVIRKITANAIILKTADRSAEVTAPVAVNATRAFFSRDKAPFNHFRNAVKPKAVAIAGLRL
jgi:hypothetical protein